MLYRNYDILMQFDNMLSGGMENVAIDLATYFSERGCTAGFLVLGETGEAVERARAKGFPVTVVDGDEAALRDFLVKNRPQLVLAHYSFKNISVYNEFNIPFIQVIHNVYAWFDAEATALFNATVKQTSLFVAVSEKVREYSIKTFAIPAEQCVTIANGIDVSRFVKANTPEVRASLRQQLDIAPSDYVFLNVSSFLSAKRILSGVQSFHLATAICPDARLLIAGYPFDKVIVQQVEAHIYIHNLGDKIRYIGHIPSLERHYFAADAFLSSTAFEGGQLTLLEALAANLAVITTNVGFAQHFKGLPGIRVVEAGLDLSPEGLAQTVDSPLVTRLAEAIALTYAERQKPDLPAACIAAMDKSRTYQAYWELFCKLTGRICAESRQKTWLELLSDAAPASKSKTTLPGDLQEKIADFRNSIMKVHSFQLRNGTCPYKNAPPEVWQRLAPAKTKSGPAILVTVLAPPLPPVSGGMRYAANQLLPFSDSFDLHLLIVGDNMLHTLVENIALYDKHFHSVTLVGREHCSGNILEKLRYYGERIRHGLPFIDVSYYSSAAVTAAREIIDTFAIDVLELHTSHAAYLKHFFPKIPALLVGHNIESGLFPYWEKKGQSLPKRLFESIVARCSRHNAKRIEIDNAWRFEALTFISQNDMEKVTNRANKYYLPLTFPDVAAPVDAYPDAPCRALWVGSFWWGPNQEGMEWFVEEVLPRIREQLRERAIEIHVAGAEPTEKIKKAHDGKNIFIHGFVEDLDALLADASLLIVPLLSGGGVRVKIVEAMSNGLPVLSTSKGCEGLEVIHKKSIWIADGAKNFAEALVKLSADYELRNTLAKGAVTYIKERHNHEHALALKKQIYGWLLDKHLQSEG
jgi:glycosyltransferase involved in cell wall biosynthesis